MYILCWWKLSKEFQQWLQQEMKTKHSLRLRGNRHTRTHTHKPIVITLCCLRSRLINNMHYIVLQSVSCVPCKKYFQKLYHASLRFDGSLTFTESHNKLWSLVKTTKGLKEIHVKTENCSSYLYRKGSQSNQNYIYID